MVVALANCPDPVVSAHTNCALAGVDPALASSAALASSIQRYGNRSPALVEERASRPSAAATRPCPIRTCTAALIRSALPTVVPMNAPVGRDESTQAPGERLSAAPRHPDDHSFGGQDFTPNPN